MDERVAELEERVGELEAEAAAERRRALVARESLKTLYLKYRAVNAPPPQASPEPAPPSYNEELTATIERLRARIAELESRPAPPTPTPPSPPVRPSLDRTMMTAAVGRDRREPRQAASGQDQLARERDHAAR